MTNFVILYTSLTSIIIAIITTTLYRYFQNGHQDTNYVSIVSKTIHDLLHIPNKADALMGTDFYN